MLMPGMPNEDKCSVACFGCILKEFLNQKL